MQSGYALKEHSTSFTIVLRAIDAVALFVSGLFCFWLRFSNLNIGNTYKSVFIIGILLGMLSLSSLGAYRAWHSTSFGSEARCVVKAIFICCVFIILSTFITQSSTLFSIIWIISWPISTCCIIVSYRFILRTIVANFRKRGWNIRQVIIIGSGDLAQKVANKLLNSPDMGLVVQGFIANSDITKDHVIVNTIKHLGNLSDVDKISSILHTDQVWIALPLQETEQMQQVQKILANTAITIRIVPDIFGFQLFNQSITEVVGLPVINLSVSHMLEENNRFLKSLADKTLSTIILFFISPILLLIAIAIKMTSSGPIIFKQYRTGSNGKNFKVYKFRSMTIHQEHNNEVTQAKKGDTRVTKIGSFLRSTSLDELPQFINVLQGRMSIVGPRPHALPHNQYYSDLVESYMKRHVVKPGITGWAQVNGLRGETETIEKMQKRIEYDLYYIENWSIWFDIKIMLLTLYKGLIHKNAF